MGHRLVEEEIERQENEQNNRIDIIAQNGNDGEHYEDLILVNNGLGINQKNYSLNVNRIHDLNDVKDILECMNLQMNVSGHPTEVQKRLINNGIFKEI